MKQSHLRMKDETCLCPKFIILSKCACEKTWLSTSQMLTRHFPFHSDSFFIAYSPGSGNEDCTTVYGKMVCILPYSVAVRALYHSAVLVKSWPVDSKGCTSKPHSQLQKDRVFIDRDTAFCWAENHSVKTVWSKDVLPVSAPSIIDLFFFLPYWNVQLESQHSAVVAASLTTPASI